MESDVHNIEVIEPADLRQAFGGLVDIIKNENPLLRSTVDGLIIVDDLLKAGETQELTPKNRILIHRLGDDPQGEARKKESP